MNTETSFVTHPLSNYSPLLTRERFAEAIGLPLGVIVGWCNKGLIPTFGVGKYSLVNVALLQKQALNKEFE
ncbi:MAG: hypothetical protein C4516_10700 [Oxalobacter sp.]|nr:MAG: hypothetical protein C4516_10700 [Oxalobacter sp.]